MTVATGGSDISCFKRGLTLETVFSMDDGFGDTFAQPDADTAADGFGDFSSSSAAAGEPALDASATRLPHLYSSMDHGRSNSPDLIGFDGDDDDDDEELVEEEVEGAELIEDEDYVDVDEEEDLDELDDEEDLDADLDEEDESEDADDEEGDGAEEEEEDEDDFWDDDDLEDDEEDYDYEELFGDDDDDDF